MPRNAYPSGAAPADGRLRPCPPSPNCVCSQDEDPRHAIAPLRCTGDPGTVMARLARVIEAMPHTRIETSSPGYLHARFQTPLLRFVDDVELLLDRGAEVVHVRSASRVGYSDFGANRKRVEAIRRAFTDESAGPAA